MLNLNQKFILLKIIKLISIHVHILVFINENIFKNIYKYIFVNGCVLQKCVISQNRYTYTYGQYLIDLNINC